MFRRNFLLKRILSITKFQFCFSYTFRQLSMTWILSSILISVRIFHVNTDKISARFFVDRFILRRKSFNIWSLCTASHKKKNEIKTISFINNLSLQQNKEDKVFDEHSLTNVITNDIAKILLNLFVSWDKLAAQMQSESSFYTFLWNHFEVDFSFYFRDYVINIQMLRKSKKEARLNRILRENENIHHHTTDENEDCVISYEKDNHEDDFENELIKNDIHDFIFISVFIFVYTRQYMNRFSFAFVYFFFSCHQNRASLLSNKSFQISHYHINMKTLYSELCDLAYMNNNTILQWKDKLIKYVKNINSDSTLTQENYENFTNQSDSTILVSMSIQIFNISIN